jgi:hypothetical protein
MINLKQKLKVSTKKFVNGMYKLKPYGSVWQFFLDGISMVFLMVSPRFSNMNKIKF